MDVVKKLWQATLYSWQGLKAVYRHQWAFRFELLAFIIAIPLSFYIGTTATQYVLLISSVFLTLIAELFNSAIETIVDRISREQHELSGRAKDIGSAAVLLTAINAGIIWVIIICARLFA